MFIEQLVKMISARLFQDTFAIPFLDSLTKESVMNLQIHYIKLVPRVRPLLSYEQQSKLDLKLR